jgi:hypothetical protein
MIWLILRSITRSSSVLNVGGIGIKECAPSDRKFLLSMRRLFGFWKTFANRLGTLFKLDILFGIGIRTMSLGVSYA